MQLLSRVICSCCCTCGAHWRTCASDERAGKMMASPVSLVAYFAQHALNSSPRAAASMLRHLGIWSPAWQSRAIAFIAAASASAVKGVSCSQQRSNQAAPDMSMQQHMHVSQCPWPDMTLHCCNGPIPTVQAHPHSSASSSSLLLP